MKKLFVVLFLLCLMFNVFAGNKSEQEQHEEAADYKYNAISIEVVPYSLNIVDFYKADYNPVHYGEKKTFLSDYALSANVLYQRRFSKNFELEAGAGYAWSKYEHIVTPDAVNFHYASVLVGGKYVYPFKNKEELELTVGGFGGALVGFNAGLTSFAPELQVKFGIRYSVKPQLSIGVTAGAGMSFWMIPEETIRNSFTFRINPVSVSVTYNFGNKSSDNYSREVKK